MADFYTPSEITVLEHVAEELLLVEVRVSKLAAMLDVIGHGPGATALRGIADALERPATETRTAAAIALQQLADQVRERLQEEGPQHG